MQIQMETSQKEKHKLAAYLRTWYNAVEVIGTRYLTMFYVAVTFKQV